MFVLGRSVVSVLILVGCLVSFPLQGLAAGFGVFTHSAHALGQSNAITAHLDQPSAVFFNPALINDLPGTQVEIGATMVAPRQEFTSASTSIATDSEQNEFFPSSFFLTHRLDSQFTLGVGLFSPFGLGTEWPEDWEGRYLATQSEMTTLDFNPVLSWRAAPNLSMAAGVAFLWLDATLQNKLNLSGFGFDDANQKFEGNGQGVGYNMGLSARLNDRIRIGLSYRSEIHVRADGKVSTQLPDGAGVLAGTFPTANGTTRLTLPRQITAGISYDITSKVVVETGFRWEEWSSFDELRITFDRPIAGTTQKITPRQWNNAFAVNLGGKYHLTDTYAVMLGFLYENSPAPDDTLEPAIPDSESFLYSIGLAADHQKFEYAISYGIQLKSDREKNNAIAAPDGSRANGNYDAHIHLLGLSFSYKF